MPVTLDILVNTLADSLADGGILTTTSASAAANEAIFSALVRSDTSQDGSTRYGGMYLYGLDAPLAGEQREIKDSGHNRTTGKLTTVRAFSGTPGNGVRFRLYSKLPRINDTGTLGYVYAINEALKELWVEDTITVTGTASGRISATTWDAWIQTSRIGQVYQPREAGEQRYDAPVSARVERSGSTLEIVLSHPCYSGEAFEMQVWRPANTYLRLSGTWAERDEDGALASAADETLAPLRLVRHVALWHCYGLLVQGKAGATNEHWMSLQERQAPRRAAAIRASKPEITRPRQAEMIGLGGTHHGLEVIP